MKRKPRYSFLLLFLFLFLSLPLHSLAKYFYLQLYDHYLVSKKFYFESDFLSLEGKNYTLENYGGTGDYIFSLNLFNYLNLEDYSEEDISYDISFSCSQNVSCKKTSEKSHVLKGEKASKDKINILLTPNEVHDGEEITLNITAKTTSSYTKVLKGSVTFKVKNYGLTYFVEDSANALYLKLHLTNLETKLQKVKLSFSKDLLSIDTTNPLVYEGNNTLESDYIKESEISLDSQKEAVIYFYKKDITKDYSLAKDIINVSKME